jgi:hypothetical protein
MGSAADDAEGRGLYTSEPRNNANLNFSAAVAYLRN